MTYTPNPMSTAITAEQIKTGDIFTMDKTGNVYTATRPPRHVDGNVLIACSYKGKFEWRHGHTMVSVRRDLPVERWYDNAR